MSHGSILRWLRATTEEEARAAKLDQRYNHWTAVRNGLMNAHAELFTQIPEIVKMFPDEIDQMKLFELIQIVPTPTLAALESGDVASYKISNARIMGFLRNNSIFTLGKKDRAKTSATYREILDAMWLFNDKFERARAKFNAVTAGGGGVARRPPPQQSRLPVLVGDEHLVTREFVEQVCRLAEVGREDVRGVACDPRRQVYGLVDAGVEADQHAGPLGADVLDRMAVALGGCSRRRLCRASRSRKRPCEPNKVTLTSPSMTYCHSSAVGCQCSSRMAPGSRSRMTPVTVCRNGEGGGVDPPLPPPL